MKCLKYSLPVLLLVILFNLTSDQTYAAQVGQLQDHASQTLVRLDIMQKDKKGSTRLKDNVKRYEFITYVNAAMSYDVEADSTEADITFKDLPKKHAGYKQIRAAYANGLIEPYKDNSIRPDKTVMAGDAVIILLKALGYGDELSELDGEGVMNIAGELGITDNVRSKFSDPLTRGNAAIYIYNVMTVDFKE